MTDIIAKFSRWAKSGLQTLLDLSRSGGLSSSLDGSSFSSLESTYSSALDDFQRIMRMTKRIEAVLEDAEEREIQDRSVKLWLSELRSLAYDIDDVVDEYEYELSRAHKEARSTKKVYHRGKHKRGDDDHHDEDTHMEGFNIFASSLSQVPPISNGMIEKLREIRQKFDEIERDRKALCLRKEDGVKRSIPTQRYQPTCSLVVETSIIGRETEKEKIVELLISDSQSNNNIQVSNKVAVIPIVGMGGVGKTTLAQLIYNDLRIHEHFDLRLWIYVSEDFDVIKLTKELYRSITNKQCEEDVGFNYLQDSIKKELTKFKRTFLVLDDVWNEKQFLWESLQVPFHNAGIVNILLTTRNKKVADVMRTVDSFILDILSQNEGWQLFQQRALCDDENLMKIGQGIVSKCGGLPLAIKLLGSHLRFERDEDKWTSILESELWNLDVGTNEIFPALRLSYQRMPIHLKPCFRYCSIFPKNRLPEKSHLIWLWMAHGYIQPKIKNKTAEEIGREYFDELLGRSLFQALEFNNSFTMHDLVFDLAVSISGNEFNTMRLEGGNQNNCMTTEVRHLAIHDESTNNEVTLVYPFQSGHVALRSIFFYGQRIIDDFQLLHSICLRALHIEIFGNNSSILKFLGSVSSWKHLRYLCIIVNYSPHNDFGTDALSSLFNASHSLLNMQVLDLLRCNRPIILPSSIKNVNSLRHLILPRGSFMPRGLNKFTDLQTLKYISVKNGSPECGGIGEIEDLENLTGSCCIKGVSYARDAENLKKANINKKKHIWRLSIEWYSWILHHHDNLFDVHICFNDNKIEKECFELVEAKLDALQPHNNIKELWIYDYCGIRFPLWLGDPLYSKLQDIKLEGCSEWDGSYQLLDRNFPCLQSISIIKCVKLKTIKIAQSSTLRRLLVENCPKITSLYGLCSLHRLEKLEIRHCCNLLISAEERLPSNLQYVWFEDCWKLTLITGLQKLHSLKELKLERCPKLKLSLDDQLSIMPSVLKIIHCPGSREWCQRYKFEVIPVISEIEELTIYDTSHIISGYGSTNLISLKTLRIEWSDESHFPQHEWIPCTVHNLHLFTCQRLKSFPPYQTLFNMRLLVITCCSTLTCLPGLGMMESLEKLVIEYCPQFMLSPYQSLPPKLQYLHINNCPQLLCLPGLHKLFSLSVIKLYWCPKLMFPPLEQLAFMLNVQLLLENCPKLIDWCESYNVSYFDCKEFCEVLFARSIKQIKFWINEVHTIFKNICVLDYDGTILETENWRVYKLLCFYISSSVHLKYISLNSKFKNLKQLRIWDCPHLEVLFELKELYTLVDLDISNCPKLINLSPFPIMLQSLAINRCNKLYSLDFHEMDLSSLEISNCSTLKFLEELQLKESFLCFLKISNCPELCLRDESLPDELNPNNVEISECPQLQVWCEEQDVAYTTYNEEG